MRKALLPLYVSVAIAAPSFGQTSFQGLGSLPGGTNTSIAHGISADGSTVVGSAGSSSGGEAFRWTASGGMQGLGDLPHSFFGSEALGVSGDGAVITGRAAGTTRVFRWTQATGMQEMPGVPELSYARAVSADGQYIVGQTPQGGYRWSQSGGLESLGTGGAHAVSANGSVVGGSGSFGGDFTAYRWTPATGAIGLGALPGATEVYSELRGVSGNGAVLVGFSAASTGTIHAFRWTDATGMVDLGDLAGGTDESRALSASFDGSVVVGLGSGPTGDEAFYWSPGTGMLGLRSYLMSLGATGLDGWRLSSATSVSADGRVIAGFGINPAGQQEGFVAVVPGPGGTLVFVLFVCGRRRRGRG